MKLLAYLTVEKSVSISRIGYLEKIILKYSLDECFGFDVQRKVVDFDF